MTPYRLDLCDVVDLAQKIKGGQVGAEKLANIQRVLKNNERLFPAKKPENGTRSHHKIKPPVPLFSGNPTWAIELNSQPPALLSADSPAKLEEGVSAEASVKKKTAAVETSPKKAASEESSPKKKAGQDPQARTSRSKGNAPADSSSSSPSRKPALKHLTTDGEDQEADIQLGDEI